MFYPRSYRALTQLCDETFGEKPQPLVRSLVDFAFGLFHGQHPLFQACDAAFHDFDHTMEATAVVLRLLVAQRAGAIGQDRERAVQDINITDIRLSPRDWELAIAAIIFHDTGYLKCKDDLNGSGAKYSTIHVGRSCFFAWDLLPEFGFSSDELRQIQNAICATAISTNINQLPFRDAREWLIGAIVATGDMVGQLAAEEYPERLPGLYLEFREASSFSKIREGSFATYNSLLDLLQDTEKFFYNYVMPILDNDWKGIYRMLDDPKGDNIFMRRIKFNVARVKRIAQLLAQP
jgi:hypothetical protein